MLITGLTDTGAAVRRALRNAIGRAATTAVAAAVAVAATTGGVLGAAAEKRSVLALHCRRFRTLTGKVNGCAATMIFTVTPGMRARGKTSSTKL